MRIHDLSHHTVISPCVSCCSLSDSEIIRLRNRLFEDLETYRRVAKARKFVEVPEIVNRWKFPGDVEMGFKFRPGNILKSTLGEREQELIISNNGKRCTADSRVGLDSEYLQHIHSLGHRFIVILNFFLYLKPKKGKNLEVFLTKFKTISPRMPWHFQN